VDCTNQGGEGPQKGKREKTNPPASKLPINYCYKRAKKPREKGGEMLSSRWPRPGTASKPQEQRKGRKTKRAMREVKPLLSRVFELKGQKSRGEKKER